ncbi:hypothetical protein K2173_025921 [Erythroxylum novogranatense]|uniref:Protein MIZU-KUSSEI 1-like n=1 Tax=Erythroxylum novogranatense TaxID=1862640 RepID=A0AAV8TXC4_9ROSI|nr:hypothetical protein K2173_025921 [Erythroxylum novogranatense]
MSYAAIDAATTISNGVTTVDCQKQVRSWRLLRSLVSLLIPTCYSSFTEEQETKQRKRTTLQRPAFNGHKPTSLITSSTIVTGTIFGFRRGKVSLCFQPNTKSTNSVVHLELPVSTATLAREMNGGFLRIALDCAGHGANSSYSRSSSLLSMPIWTIYFNGRRVGYAVKRKSSKTDLEALKLMNSVVTGAGIISGKEFDSEDELMYLRGKFERVRGSSEAESFHLIDPEGNIGQELSVFFYRSR